MKIIEEVLENVVTREYMQFGFMPVEVQLMQSLF